ncbi:MAG: hypothetical protein ACJ79K_04530 [Gemmatimonadaceae bacterium]
MSAGIAAAADDASDEVGARMQGRERANLHGVKNAEHVEFSFLGEIGSIGEKSKGNAHAGNYEKGRGGTRDEEGAAA